LTQTAFNFAALFLAKLGMAWGIANLRLTEPADPAGLPFLALLLGGVGLLTMPIVNAISRWRETMADEYAIQITQKPEPFASAMTRLANQNLADVDPERWVVLLFHAHPPLRDRIRRARQFSALGD
jgi:STE24 endopeptidase